MSVMPPIWRSRASSPEQHLAAAILAQAFTDMFLTDSHAAQAVDTVAVEAMRFLTDRHGHSASWRNQWCACLDLDGDMLAARVRMILDGEIDPPSNDGFGNRLHRARERWARVSRLPSTPSKRHTAPLLPAPPKSPPPPPPPPGAIIIPDDPFYQSLSGHICASRRWRDGETSRFLGPLPPLSSKTGQALWTITQVSRAGRHAISCLCDDPDALVNDLRQALPSCEIGWTSRGQRLAAYQPNAGLRVYLKQSAKAA